ncbi:unnamed protein product [Gemmata massiliana]|uniref:Uncharacterized protein n=1 Tax=Gemmata massiliana TaxID=1210884 RepID=A0A6P2D7L7_9BACT|nr:hypothetical protein [Gemmata massiliana]VTR97331.1 unnamed protein product [Gemmata massiliana]
MAFITRYRGHLREYSEEVDESMLFQEVTLDEYLALQYPTFREANHPEQARIERAEIQAATMQGDRLWLWRRIDESNRTDGSASEWGGLAVTRGGKIIRAWLVWMEH